MVRTDLLIEITSPSTADNDRHLKRRIYERSGTAEYWIVDPAEPSVTQLVLRDGVYVETSHGDELRPAILPGVVIPLPEVW